MGLAGTAMLMICTPVQANRALNHDLDTGGVFLGDDELLLLVLLLFLELLFLDFDVPECIGRNAS